MDNKDNNNDNEYDKKTFAYVAIGLIIAGAVALGLAFTALGTYTLYVSMVLEIAAVSFARYQQKLKNFKWLIYIQIAAYVIFGAALVLFFVL